MISSVVNFHLSWKLGPNFPFFCDSLKPCARATHEDLLKCVGFMAVTKRMDALGIGTYPGIGTTC